MKIRLVILSIIIILIITPVFYIQKITASDDFPMGAVYTIKSGSGLNFLATDLADKNIIRSPFWFKVFSVLIGGTKGIIAGDYVFDNKENVFLVAYRISQGDFYLVPVRITIPEGLNTTEISKLLEPKFTKINSSDFVNLASSSEGYLFPDTYLFLPNIIAEDIIKVMKENFQKRILALNTDIINFKKPLTDIIKMASILELEARTTETRQIVAGILWKRLDLGMPLQVDASFKYINGKTTKTLTSADLKFDSPYNSYLYKGLPPTPISNPGLDSIKASVTPIKTNYLYFLTDDKGNMHYAETYAKHLQNKEMYLK
jgi:UPF0755 protein